MKIKKVLKQLNSHLSGDLTELVELEIGIKAVRKTSKKKPKALEKRKGLVNLGFKCPEIIQPPKEDGNGKWFYLMEHIEGSKTIAEHLRDTDDLRPLYFFLSSYFHTDFSTQGNSATDWKGLVRGRIVESIDLILSMCGEKKLKDCIRNSYLEISFLEEGLEGLVEDACHGDLTFDNILVLENQRDYYKGFQFVLIDFHDTDFQNVYFDGMKLLQDLRGGFFLRNCFSWDEGTKVKVFKDILEKTNRIHKGLCGFFPKLSEDRAYLFTLLRLVPVIFNKGIETEKSIIRDEIITVCKSMKS